MNTQKETEPQEVVQREDEQKDTAGKEVGNRTKYSVAELCENAVALFGVKSEVVMGALHDCYQTTVGRFTKKQVKAAIDKFMKRTVK